jgi:hypothetical protein
VLVLDIQKDFKMMGLKDKLLANMLGNPELAEHMAKMRKELDNMTPEEKAKMKAEMTQMMSSGNMMNLVKEIMNNKGVDMTQGEIEELAKKFINNK